LLINALNNRVHIAFREKSGIVLNLERNSQLSMESVFHIAINHSPFLRWSMRFGIVSSRVCAIVCSAYGVFS
jgi:hypothetical protein